LADQAVARCACGSFGIRHEQNFFAVRRDNDRFLSGPTGQLAASLRQRGRRDSAWNSGLLEQREKIASPEFVNFEFPCGKQWPPPNDAGNYTGPRRRTATLPVGSFRPNSIGLLDRVGTFGNGVSTLVKAPTVQLVAIGGGCAAAPGPQVIASKCNPLTET
jgi:hypothetical protein